MKKEIYALRNFYLKTFEIVDGGERYDFTSEEVQVSSKLYKKGAVVEPEVVKRHGEVLREQGYLGGDD